MQFSGMRKLVETTFSSSLQLHHHIWK